MNASSQFIALGALLLSACPQLPAKFGTGNPCQHCDVDDEQQRQACIADCLSPPRNRNADYAVSAPRFWHFYDDLAERLPPLEACGSGDESFGNLRPLWRRAMPFGYVTGAGVEFEGRSGVSVSHGRLATSLGQTLWLLDSRTGEVQNAFRSAWRKPAFEEPTASASEQLAALTPDGDGVWIWSMGPILVDLKHIDPARGPKAVFAAEHDVSNDDAGPVTFDIGFFPSPAVAPDGTFYWTSPFRRYSMATARHLEVSLQREPAFGSKSHGQVDLTVETKDVMHADVKWAKKIPVGGRAVVADDGTVYWASGTAMNPDSTIKWQARPPNGWAYYTGGTTELERAGKRSYWPMLWREQTDQGVFTGREVYVAHSLVDGSALWTQVVPRLATAQTIYSGSFSAQGPDGTLYLASRPYDSPTPNLSHGYIEARDGGTGDLMWQLELPSAEGRPSTESSRIRGGPVPAPNGDGVYVASDNCKLYHLNRDGGVVGWFRMAGQPVDDIPQLADGILYVVTEAKRNLDGGRETWCALFQPDSVERYDCFYPECGPCVRDGSLVYLYAFKVD